MHLLHNFVWFCQKHNSLPIGPIKPSSPSTKELHGLELCTRHRGLEVTMIPLIGGSNPVIVNLEQLFCQVVSRSAPQLFVLGVEYHLKVRR